MSERVDRIDDEPTRRRIREELDRNFMVEAAAGTGKTTCIIDRMVNLVAFGACDIDHLVAVTFTRKAAAELLERFQARLRERAAEYAGAEKGEARDTYVRLQSASDHVNRAFVGTIHSLCASMLRERPVEFGVDPGFRELDEEEDAQLRETAWLENLNDLFASNDPLLDEIEELAVERAQLKSCFHRFIEYRDVQDWPNEPEGPWDVDSLRRDVGDYVAHIRQLLPFPAERGTDQLMARYEEIVRRSENERMLQQPRHFFRLLEKFDRGHGARQTYWAPKSLGKQEKDRWEEFRKEVATPAVDRLRRQRYGAVVALVRRALAIYQRLKSCSGALDFTDLLLRTATGLREQPLLRRYFQRRFTHLLVDEFQDTDPIQAEMILLLTGSDLEETDSFHCRPRPGSLFLVGDPKQSIYRFRRGDIVTYNRVKEVFTASGGEVLSLVKNFRSGEELIHWNNKVYRQFFLPEANQYRTAASDMLCGRVDACQGQQTGIRRLSVPSNMPIDDATRQEADTIARFIRNAIDSGMTVSRRQEELEQGRGTAVEPRDFLVIPRNKTRIHLFKAALDQYEIPCEVSGGNALTSIQPLHVLIQVIRAVDDPDHAVHYLAILRDTLFGFSDADLYEFRRLGGQFSFLWEVPSELPAELRQRFEQVNYQLRRFRIWLRTQPFSTAISRIATDLGLLASAAVQRDGNIALGGFLKAIEVVRARSADFDSASDLLGYLDRLETIDEIGGCSALPPNQNVVRVMNLHKAKGLEAPIVFLCDTSPRFSWDPDCHIDRTGDRPVGFMGIVVKEGFAKREIATPPDWKNLQKEEQKFLDAEEERLHYVATTRAASLLVISVGKDKSRWSDLHPHLQDVEELTMPSVKQADGEPPGATQLSATATLSETIDFRRKWDDAGVPSHIVQTAKEVGLKGSPRPDWQASGDYGYKWGSAVHELLEVAAKHPQANLPAFAKALSEQYDLGHERLPELLETVRAVMQSEIWQRARAAAKCFSELPLETTWTDSTGGLQLLRGVIDLIFAEKEGWVIVDYKTDDIQPDDLASAVAYYQSQLEAYARHWRVATGWEVVELGLYFTRLDRYVVCESRGS